MLTSLELREGMVKDSEQIRDSDNLLIPSLCMGVQVDIQDVGIELREV